MTTTETLSECYGSWATDENEYSTDELIADINEVCADKIDFINQFLNFSDSSLRSE